MNEWRVTWRREKGRTKHRIYQTEAAARRFYTFLDANREWRPPSDFDEGPPAPLPDGDIEEVTLEHRGVQPWRLA